MTPSDLKNRPYSFYFLFGAISAILGVLLWILSFNGTNLWENPIEMHKIMMFGLFMYSFISGFIFTALPSFTGGPKLSFYLLILNIIIKFSELSFFLFDSLKILILFLILDFLMMIGFIFVHFVKKKSNAPKSFWFVSLGPIYGLLYFFPLLFDFDTTTYNHQIFLEYGFILNIILGVGLKVLPVLMGQNQNAFSFSIEKKKKDLLSKIKDYSTEFYFFFLNLFVIIASFLNESLGLMGVAITLCIIFYNRFNFTKYPKSKSYVARGIWFALWFVVFGTILGAVPMLGIFGRHFYFIAGLGLLTIMVGTRVSIAHGGHSITLESTLQGINLIILLCIVSAIFRFMPSVFEIFNYEIMIQVAALIWILFISTWFFMFVKKIYQPN